MFKPTLALLMSSCLVVATAAPPSIGMVTSPGDFRIDGSTIHGNSTLFEGASIETASARSVLEVSGAQVTLSPESRAKAYRDRTILENGSGLVKDGDKYAIEAGTLRISSAAKGSLVQVDVAGPRNITVVARAGSADVRTATGLLVAKVNSGTAVSFDPQAGASTAAKMTGQLKAANGKFLLTDRTTNVTVELQGADLAKYAGKTVEVTGSTIPNAMAVAGASQVVQVTDIKVVGSNKKAAAATAGAAAGAGAGAAGGIGAATTVAIVGGVAAAGTVGGLAAAGSFSGSSSVSR